ncbi:MAG: hypothetical protein ACPLQO_07780, partial [Desulfotomaculales bacterium]
RKRPVYPKPDSFFAGEDLPPSPPEAIKTGCGCFRRARHRLPQPLRPSSNAGKPKGLWADQESKS